MGKGAPVQMMKKCLTTTAILVCALIAFAFGGVAYAAGDWWTSDSNSLTVVTDESALVKDVAAGTAVEVDVYKIADAEADDKYQTFNYTLVSPFNTDALSKRLESALKGGGSEWELLAMEALEKTKGFNVDKTTATLQAGTDGDKPIAYATMNDLKNGLYLMVPHGAGEDPLKATGKKNNYTFSPSIVALPTKNDGEYDTVVQAKIKPAVKPPAPPSSSTSSSSSSSSSSKSSSSSTPPKGHSTVQTGDDTNLFPFYVAMAVSGALLVILGFYGLRQRKREGGNNEG